MSHDYHIAAEPDVSGLANRSIWTYFIVLALLLLITVAGLSVMFTMHLDSERSEKIGAVQTRESLDQTVLATSYLSGKKGIFVNKRNVAIDEAIKRFLEDARKAK